MNNDLKPPIVGQPNNKQKEKEEGQKSQHNYDNKNVELITHCIILCLLIGGSVFLLYNLLFSVFNIFLHGGG